MNRNSSKPKKEKKPWPTKAAMQQVYKMKLWGSNNTTFYSGEGSHHPKIVEPYVEAITLFLKSFKKPLTVCDLGCGDFNVGCQLFNYTKHYTAIDIVPELIAYNTNKFKSENLEFKCLDIAAETLPKADCVIIRQVLQHLSNAEIRSLVNKLSAYKYIILTEHLPNANFSPNIDIISGQGTRLKKKSGVNILEAPFSFNVKTKQEILRVDLGERKGVIVTDLYQT